MPNKGIYLDNAATTYIDPQVVKAMEPYLNDKFGNPSTIYKIGREVRAAIDDARHTVASFIGADDAEIVFTSCGTESNNLALIGAAYANEAKGNHIITLPIEHHSVIEPLKFLAKRGFDVTYVPVDKNGLVDPEEIKKAITDKTIIISVMHANNEIGTIEPVNEIGKITKEKGIIFLTDAVQTISAVPVNVDEIGCDLLSISAHKFYGPKGVGALYIRKGTRLVSHLYGGEQERRRRAGTENVAGIIGIAKAIEIASKRMKEDSVRISGLRDKLID
ncbi:MAG: aminotransferase class V-fold PLP-dependent enzyme, partial [Actinobacteria bacterium]